MVLLAMFQYYTFYVFNVIWFDLRHNLSTPIDLHILTYNKFVDIFKLKYILRLW